MHATLRMYFFQLNAQYAAGKKHNAMDGQLADSSGSHSVSTWGYVRLAASH